MYTYGPYRDDPFNKYAIDPEHPERYFISKTDQPRLLRSKKEFEDTFDAIYTLALNRGLDKEQIKSIFLKLIIPTSRYDVNFKKKFLNYTVPDEDFPYELIPKIIGTISNEKIQYTKNILSWLSALLEYNVISKTNVYVSLCYPIVFRLISFPSLNKHACKFLLLITQNHHVTRLRIGYLIQYAKIIGCEAVDHLLRLYATIRPDLYISRFRKLVNLPSIPEAMIPLLEAARTRLLESSCDTGTKDAWPMLFIQKNNNPFVGPSPFPSPEILLYPEKFEDRIADLDKIHVTGFKNFTYFVDNLHNYHRWSWPNSVTSLLRNPQLLFCFRSHKVEVRVQISCWLEFAYKSEFFDVQVSNGKWQKLLLDLMSKLLRSGNDYTTAIGYFLMEFLPIWDGVTHFPEVMRILENIPLLPIQLFDEVIVAKIMKKLFSVKTAARWVNALTVLTSLSCNIIYRYSLKRDQKRAGNLWAVWDQDFDVPLIIIYNMNQWVTKEFMKALIQWPNSALVRHTILDYYMQVNDCSLECEVEMIVIPEPIIVLNLISSWDLSTTMRTAQVLVRMKETAEELDSKLNSSDYLTNFYLLKDMDKAHKSLQLFYDSIFTKNMFASQEWQMALQSKISNRYFGSIVNFHHLRYQAMPLYNMAYLHLWCTNISDPKFTFHDDKVREEYLEDVLKQNGLGELIKFKESFLQINDEEQRIDLL